MKSINEIYCLVLETLLVEAVSLEEIFKKYYSNDKDIRLTLEIFKKINLIDPTGTDSKRGRYLDWLIRKVYKQNPRILEDSTKIKEDLSLFDKNYRHINKQITQIKDQYELASLVEQFREKKEKGEIDLSRSEIKKDIEKIYEDDTWLVLTPKTIEAAKYYGKNTRWCTAAEKDNYFDHYNKQGPLYIVINKKAPDEKYQFHFQTEQYMDSKDIDIEQEIYNKFPEKVLDKLVEMANKNIKVVMFISQFPEDIFEKYKQTYAHEIKKHNLSLKLANNAIVGHFDMVKYCIENGADIHIDDDAALREAADNGHLEIVKYLVEKGADIHALGDATLINAADKNYFEIVKYLVEKGADIHTEEDFALRIAARQGYLEIVKYLVEKGANVNAADGYSLIKAVYNRYFEMVKYLVEKGADVHADNDKALRSAAHNGWLEIVKYLVEKGANIHANSDRALRSAISNEHDEIAKYLIDHGANIDVLPYYVTDNLSPKTKSYLFGK